MKPLSLDADADAALAPVRDALLARARAEADRMLADADADAARLRRAAQEEVARRLADARGQGAADAGGPLASDHVRAQRQARAVVLAARRETYEALVRDCRAAVTRLSEDAAYPQLLERLAEQVRDLLGDDVTISVSPDGGVLGLARGRRVDASLPALADRALARLGERVGQLWTP